MAGDYCSLLKMKDNFSIYHNPECDKKKPATENAYMTRFMFFAEPSPSLPPTQPSSTLERREKKWLKFTSCTF